MIYDEMFNLGVSYIPQAAALVIETSSADAVKEAEDPITIGKYKISPWGESNDTPNQVNEKIKANEVVGANLLLNNLMAYGQGIIPVKKVVTGNEVRYEECRYPKVNEFFERNDIPLFFLEQCIDMNSFGNVFPEFILNASKNEILSIRHLEATFSRWGVIEPKLKRISKHYYSSKWVDGASEKDLIESDVLDRYDPVTDLKSRLSTRNYKELRFVMPVYFPSPGKTYYQEPAWWSIFRSGSYDFAQLIWPIKKAMVSNGLRVRYIVYVSKSYWDNIFTEERIDRNDPNAVAARKSVELEKWRVFLADEKNHGKGMMITKEMKPVGNSAIEEKYITIEPVNIEQPGGELVSDIGEVNNVLSYAMSVHPNLVGISLGKNGGSLSGTDKRELFMIKDVMMKPFVDRLMRPLRVVKAFNNWPADVEFIRPSFNFTTLDDNKEGKETTIPTPTK